MLVPIFIGLFIDSKIGKGQTFAIIGFFVGIVGGIYVIRTTIKKVTAGNKF